MGCWCQVDGGWAEAKGMGRVVEIHKVHWGNKWMGSLTLMIEQYKKVEQLAGASKQ